MKRTLIVIAVVSLLALLCVSMRPSEAARLTDKQIVAEYFGGRLARYRAVHTIRCRGIQNNEVRNFCYRQLLPRVSSVIAPKSRVVSLGCIRPVPAEADDTLLANPTLRTVSSPCPLLSDRLPAEVSELRYLSLLSITAHGLRELPPELGRLSRLEILYLDHNQLQTLPPELGNLTDLRELDLRHNNLRELPPELGNLTNLETLLVAGNPIKTVPPEILALPNLRNFDWQEIE